MSVMIAKPTMYATEMPREMNKVYMVLATGKLIGSNAAPKSAAALEGSEVPLSMSCKLRPVSLREEEDARVTVMSGTPSVLAGPFWRRSCTQKRMKIVPKTKVMIAIAPL